MSRKHDVMPKTPKIVTDILQHCQWYKVGTDWYEVGYKGHIIAEMFRVKTKHWYGLIYDGNRIFRGNNLRMVELVIVGSVLNTGNYDAYLRTHASGLGVYACPLPHLCRQARRSILRRGGTGGLQEGHCARQGAR